jgi:hypothetical protein
MQRIWQLFARPFRALFRARRLTLIFGISLTLCLLTLLTTKRAPMHYEHSFNHPASETGGHHSAFFEEEKEAGADRKSALAVLPLSSDGGSGYPAAGEPRIAYSAELGLLTRQFAHSRSSMEEILERHRGYTARLRMVGQSSGSTLSATLKVPASEYAATLAELKSVGNLEHDEEAADEIVQQRGDLEARLQNAQNTERRLLEQLKDRSGKIFDPAPVERQLGELHREMARLESDRRLFDNRAVFSNIRLSLREEILPQAESFSAKFRFAITGGLSDAIEALSAILLVIANYGPSFLLWGAICYFPARIVWRRATSKEARASV